MYSTQKNIRQVEIGPLKGDLLPAVKKYPQIFKNMNGPSGLFIWPNSLEALELGQMALQGLAPSVNNLLINCHSLKKDSDSTVNMMD